MPKPLKKPLRTSYQQLTPIIMVSYVMYNLTLITASRDSRVPEHCHVTHGVRLMTHFGICRIQLKTLQATIHDLANLL